MSTGSSRCLVLRKTKLGETDTIVHLLLEDGTIVRAVVKGARKPGSRLGGHLEPFCVVDATLHPGRSLHIVTDVRTVASHRALREDFERSSAAAVVLDLSDRTGVESGGDARAFGLACATLAAMEDAPITSLSGLVAGFVLKALALHGCRPELESCCTCGGEAGVSDGYAISAGGPLCDACASDTAITRVTPEARAWIRMLLGSTMTDIAASDMPEDAARDCLLFASAFSRHHIPARLRGLDFFLRTHDPD